MKILAAGYVLTICLLVSNLVVATGSEPRSRCASDSDCPGCERCVDGVCPGAEPKTTTCMCPDECTPAGFAWCDVSSEKPLCGGVCVADGTSARALTCGAGDDVPRVDRVNMPVMDKPRVELSDDHAVVEEYSSPRDENDARGLR
jgi:hypothetical protein